MSSKTEKVAVPTGVKLHELAKEMGIPSKMLLEKALELGMKVKSHSSTVTLGQADRLRAKLGGSKMLKEKLESKTRVSVRKQAEPADDGSGSPEAAVAEQQAEAPAAEQAETPAAPSSPAEEIESTSSVTPPDVELQPAPAAAAAVVEPESAPAPVAEQAPAEEPAAAEAPPAPEKPVIEEARPAAPSRFGVVTPASAVPPTPPPPAKPAPARPAPAAPKTLDTRSIVPPPISTPPKRILSGPEVAPPIQRVARSDPRFGVVTPAPPEPEKPKEAPKPAARKGSQQVESQKVDDFKPQVSYPSLPDSFRGGGSDDEESRARAAGLRRPGRAVPAGMKGFSSGPRRGVALLRGDDDRFRGARRPKQRNLAPKPLIRREGPADVTSPVTIKALCEALGIKATDLIRKFLEQGKMVTINTILPDSDAEIYALEFDPLKHGITIKKARDVEEELLKKADVADKPEDLRPRGPVVTIMGHVDHGKTSLLDYIRNAKVAAGEAGGITQHIGAYKVHHTKGDVTFLDTPGHKAFTEMRARGANVTDVVILVVAATDGVMPQTEEAISHAKQAAKKIVVALNKVDLPESNPDRVKGQLAAKELFVEGYGGDVGCVEVSAKTGFGVDNLLDRILLEAELLELKANPNKPAFGTVIEAHKDQGRGIVCTLLVQEGTLKQGDVIICGHAYGSVRQIFSDTGKPREIAGPSTPVLVTGLNEVPLSGERFHVMDSIKDAAEIAEQRAMRMRQEGLIKRAHVTLETLSDLLAQGAVASLKLVLKVDVMGSLAPLRNEISKLSRPDARIDILHDGVGAINETDVLLADASDAIVIGFGVTADPGARRLAEERNVDIRTFSIIYEVVDVVGKALEGLLKPIEREVIQGHVAIRQTFKISKIGTIAGCFVTDGVITRNSSVRLIRDGKPVWSGKLASLKRVKDDAKEVRSGFECGIKLDGFDDIKQGDLLEAFTTEQVKRTLDGK
ncbi:MAG TPA: translation initiation factor IF-2 [Planctomycetota bacterium]|nr:translation initiation factor IF-2 [Planctomycetota bacterium]